MEVLQCQIKLDTIKYLLKCLDKNLCIEYNYLEPFGSSLSIYAIHIKIK